jgi:hypothetical protein
MGQLRNGWRVIDMPDGGCKLENSAPHAGVVEMGARPHKVSRAGRQHIAEWAMRKLGLDEKEAASFAFALAKKLEARGQEPTYFTRKELETLAGFIPGEVTAEIRKVAEGKK